MNPLSPFTYYRRHKHQALLMVGLVTLVTLGIYVMVGMLYPVLESVSIVDLGPLKHSSLIYPDAGSSPEPNVVSQVQAHPDVARVIPENGLGLFVQVPALVATSALRVLGVPEADMPVVVDVCGLRLQEGRLPKAYTNELVLSEELAIALGLRVGDQVDRSVDEHYYVSIPSPLVLVGILETDPSATLKTGPSIGPEQGVRMAMVSYEYLNSHELYAPRQSGLLVIAKQGRKPSVDDFLESAILSPHTHVETRRQADELTARTRRTLNLVLGVVDGLVAVVVTLVIGAINQIALAQRLADLGVLHAIGHHKRRLIHYLTLETTVIAGVGWLIGLALAWLALAWLKINFYAPRGMALNLANPAPLQFAVPIPLAVIGFAAFSVIRVFTRLDAVSIIERGKLSTEARGRWQAAKESSARPLSSWIFYLRHRRRGLMLVAVMGLMILGVAFPVFFFSPMIDAQKPLFLNYLRYVGMARPGVGGAVDPGVTAQIKSHPSVARVIPATNLWLTISIPPVSMNTATIYGVSEDDLSYLVDLFKLRLKEGRLPRPRSNEVVLSEALAMNRDLRVGDAIGRPVCDLDADIPIEMVVVGIFSSSDVSLGFASSEYLRSHELTSSMSVRQLIVPAKGRKAELDAWLEQDVASTRTLVATYDARSREMRQAASSLFLLIAAFESVVAIVAAIALAALNYIFFAQRREEFGILHAVGRSRPWLVLRTTRETLSVVAVAWLIGAGMCVGILIYAQANIYAPIGLSLNFFNLAPWLFTLPIPLAVVAASAGTIAWMLFRLDPVSVVERR